jgi:site-specific recombinase XerD
MLPARLPSHPESILQQSLAYMRAAGKLTASSITLYTIHVQQYEDFCHVRNFNPLVSFSLAEWRDELINLPEQLSPNTISNKLSAIKRAIAEAAKPERGLVLPGTDVLFNNVEGPGKLGLKGRLKQTTRLRISSEDMRLLCNMPDKSDLIGARDAALLAVLASSGLRNQEAGRLRVEQVTMQHGGYALSVTGKKDVLPRVAPLSIEAFNLMGDWLSRRTSETKVVSPFIFTAFKTAGRIPQDTPLSAHAVLDIVQHYIEKAGLTHLEGATPHSFRRYVGTTLARSNPHYAQMALGHKRIETTYEHYVLDDLPAGITNNLY